MQSNVNNNKDIIGCFLFMYLHIGIRYSLDLSALKNKKQRESFKKTIKSKQTIQMTLLERKSNSNKVIHQLGISVYVVYN